MTPFGQLTDAEAGKLVKAYARGERIEFMTPSGDWHSCQPNWASAMIYRIAPTTADSINWDHVAAGWGYMARDGDGEAHFYKKKPAAGIGAWAIIVDCDWSDFTLVSAHASYVRGTCDWRDSLVIRPGVEG